MNFVSRFFGTFFDPGKTFSSLAERPIWLDALVLVLIALAVTSYISFPFGQKDNLQMVEDSAAKIKDKYGEAGYNAAVDRVKNANRILASLVMSPLTLVIGFLFSSLVVLGMGRLVSTQGHYLQVFSALVHANFVDKILGNAVRLALILSRKSVLQTTTGLPVLFPKMAVTSTAYIVLSQVDFFQLWMFGLFGWGLSSVFKISARKGLIISYILWLLKSLLMIGFGLWMRRFLQ